MIDFFKVNIWVVLILLQGVESVWEFTFFQGDYSQ